MTGRTLPAALLLILATALSCLGQQPWVSLFDGESLNGWKVEREGKFTVEDGAIVGRQGSRHLPGDLFTSRAWSDFELEAEWQIEGPADSGIWFRRTVMKTGYQADLSDGPKVELPGSLWCYGKGFVALNSNPSTVRRGNWNRIHIRAVGDEITIQQNGTTVVHVRDGAFQAGSIGIQIPDGKGHDGMAVRIRNIRIRKLRATPTSDSTAPVAEANKTAPVRSNRP